MRWVVALAIAASMAAGALRACDAEQTVVTDVYPTGATLPENLLRVYIYFSAPMGRGDILPAIDLLDAQGRAVEGVFLSNRYDLWSADRTRLTLLLDPGRVKTGLQANVAMGRVLVPGETYTLRISETAEDAQGCTLASHHAVTFTATEPDLSSPSPAEWQLIRPASGTREPLTVILDGPVDHLSLAYRLRVIGPDGAPVPGRIDLGAEETRWFFRPRQPWPVTPHRLAIDPMLEDLAGNRPGALFDHPVGTPTRPWHRTLEFSPTPP